MDYDKNLGPHAFYTTLSKLINWYFPWNHQKTIGFLMISEEIEVI